MQNYGVRVAHYFQIISEGNTTILHFAFCILHFGHRPINNNLSHFLHPERDIHKMFTDFDIFLLQFPAGWVIMY